MPSTSGNGEQSVLSSKRKRRQSDSSDSEGDSDDDKEEENQEEEKSEEVVLSEKLRVETTDTSGGCEERETAGRKEAVDNAGDKEDRTRSGGDEQVETALRTAPVGVCVILFVVVKVMSMLHKLFVVHVVSVWH